MLAFDPATHAYTLDGVRVPSVTQVLADVGLIDARWFTDGSCLRGRYVAQAVAYDQRGELDYDGLDDALKPYVDAAREFRAKMGFVPALIEHSVCSATWRYAGTLDAIGSSSAIGGELLIDFKAGVAAAWHPLQTIAYAMTLSRTMVRACVLLRPNGSFKFIEHTDDQADEQLWLAAVQVFHAKERMAV